MYRVSVLFSVSTLTIALFSASVSCAEDKAAAREADCLAKKTSAEQRVCLDQNLSQRDALLNELYQELRGKLRPSDAEGLGQDQRVWQRERDGCGVKTSCLAGKYTDRVADLEQMLENLAFPNKSHVEIGCGAGQQFVDGECLDNVAMGDESSTENDMQWMLNRYSDDGPTTLVLTYGIPETDAMAFQATCAKTENAKATTTLFAYDTSGFKEGSDVVLSLTTAKDTLQIPGKIYGTELEVGISGVQLTAGLDHPYWSVLSRGKSLTYQVAGKEPAQMKLKGGRKTIRKFVSDCRAVLASRPQQLRAAIQPAVQWEHAPSLLHLTQLTEPEGAPVLSEPEGTPVLSDPEGSPLSEPEGAPVLSEPEGAPAASPSPQTEPAQSPPSAPAGPSFREELAKPMAPAPGQKAQPNASGMPTGRLEACKHRKKKKTRKHVWQANKTDVGAIAYVSECPSCEMGMAIICNARNQTLELSVPWLAMENGQADASITFDVCIDGEGAEFNGTTEHQGMIGYLPKMKIWPTHPLAKTLTVGKFASVRFQGQWAHFRLKGSKSALEKMAALCR